jgi:ATP-dependent DNA helicase RecG
MRELMVARDLLPPTFESSRRPDQFVATFLFHHFLTQSDLDWLGSLTRERLSDEEARALVFVREVGAIDNAAYRMINKVETLTASAHLRRLRDNDLLTMKGSGSRTYYTPGTAFRVADTAEGPLSNPDPHHPSADPHHLGADPHHLGSVWADLPAALKDRIEAVGKRPRRPKLHALILELCAWRALSARELAALMSDRDPKVLVREHLSAMLADQKLVYTIPEMPHHPEQKYRTSDVESST